MLAVTAIATLIKGALNVLGNLHISVIPCHSVKEARERGTLIAELDITPRTLEINGQTIEFDEAWIEEAADPDHHFVWFSYYRRVGYYYLCFTISRGHEAFNGVEPPFFVIEGDDGSVGTSFVRGQVYQFTKQRESADLSTLRMSLMRSWDDERTNDILIRRKE
jgi:hypothetical protein